MGSGNLLPGGFVLAEMDLKSMNCAREALAEFVGSFFLIIIGVGAIHGATFNAAPLGSAEILQIGLGFGLGIGCCVHLFSDISGGQYNPAVSFALFFAKKISLARAAIFTLAQILGGLLGCGVMWAILDKCPGAVGLGSGVSGASGLFIEFFGTLFLVLTVLANVNELRGHANGFQQPLSIGITIFVIHMFLVPTTGCGINPARSLVTNLVNWEFPSTFYIYIIGPMMAAVVGGLGYTYVFEPHYSPCRPLQAVAPGPSVTTSEHAKHTIAGVCAPHEKRTSFVM